MMSAKGFMFHGVQFPFFMVSIPVQSTSFGVYISQLIRFTRLSGPVTDFNALYKILTGKLILQGYGYHNFYFLPPTP